MVLCVPRTSANPPSWDRLFETAAAQDGHVTTAQATEAGFSSQLVAHYVKVGRLLRAHRGVYRLARYPRGDHEDLTALWLWTGQVGVVSHETALALHGLSDVLPSAHDITLPASWKRRRMKYPRGLRPHFDDVREDERAWLGAVPVTSPLRTVVDCYADHVQPDLVEQAVRDGMRRGHFTRAEVSAARRARNAA
jgi:predicted transcriptional regulator of viral defense system